MRVNYNILLIPILHILCFTLQAQDCIEYPIIDGPSCVVCVPEGWEIGNFTPDIFVPDAIPGPCFYINDVPSPSGGNFVHLQNGNSNVSESITTEVCDLDPNIYYSFGLYWLEMITVDNPICQEACSGNTLVVEIDGASYEFDNAETWTLIEFCFFPESSCIDILIYFIPSSSALNPCHIAIDDVGCELLTPCCELLVEAEETYSLCNGEMININAEYFDEIGDVNIEWRSLPIIGINYLNDLTIINPQFSFPEDENYEGEIFQFTVSVSDNFCTIEKEIEIEVLPSEVPEFDFIICLLNEDFTLPNVSENGYSGTWVGEFDFESIGGTIQSYTFILSPNQNNCLLEYDYEIPILEGEELFFDIEEEYCVLDNKNYELPESSIDNISGKWNIESFNPSQLGPGNYEFIFSADDQYCYYPYILDVEILNADTLNFDIPSEFCVTDSILILPSHSIDSILGTWNFPSINLNTTIENDTLVFTPNDIDSCSLPYIHSYSVLPEESPSFSISESICRTQEIIILDSLSDEGYLGFWVPQEINLDTINSTSFSSSWTSIDTNLRCVKDTLVTFSIIDPVTPQFELPNTLCINSGIYILPTISNDNQILGAWSIPEIDTDNIGAQIIDLIFLPADEHCALSISASINIINNIDPEFSFPTEFCSMDDDLILPMISDNGIEGTWSIATIQPNLIITQVISIFTPDDPLSCINNFEAIFTVSNLITPQFDLPLVFCADDDVFTFPALSSNNIQGSWSEIIFDPSIYTGDEFTNTFTPLDLTCSEVLNITLPIVRFNNIRSTTSNPSSCSANDGSISFDNALEFEFSIDNGITWQIEPVFENLEAGNYQIIIRHSIHINCTEDFDFQLTVPSAPVILMIEAIGISDCGLTDGMVTCTADGSNLEYSIDDGTTWQSDNSFSNLNVGNYIMLVRADGDSDCSTQQAFSIDDIINVLIEDVLTMNISDCGIADGEISILPNDAIYEYSIDGIIWQESNIFINLDQGDYKVLIRLKLSPNCTDEIIIEIFSPINPDIIEVNNSNPSDCGIEDGSITIEASGIDLEFSIDNGTTWSDNNIFDNLPSGNYTIIVREKDAPNCTDETNIILETPNTPEITAFELKQPTDCITKDASITITTSNNDVEFSIDGGANWQSSGIFENLDPQNYQVIVRNTISLDCTTQISFEIIEIPCPCNDNLDIEIITTPVTCLSPTSGTIEILNIEGLFTNQPTTITWNNNQEGQLIENLESGWYSYNIDYDQNCSFEDSIYVENVEPISFDLLSFDPDCQNLGSIEVTNLEGGSGTFLFSLDDINYQNSDVFFNLSPQHYIVYVQDMLDCSGVDNIELSANYTLELELPSIQPIQAGTTVFLNPLINETTIDSFTWTTTGVINNPGDLVAQVSPSETTEYSLIIYFGSCIELRTIIIEVIKPSSIYVPNIINIHSSDNNNTFFVQSSTNSQIKIDEVLIYDRWGNLVFRKENPQLNDPSDGWDGRFKNEPALQGVYAFIVKYNVNGEDKVEAGSVTLLR